jgi:hypothetical protein
MTTIAQQLIEQLKGFLEMDFATTPSAIFVKKLKNELIHHGFEVAVAEVLAVSIDVELPAGAASTEEIEEFARLYGALLEKSWQNFHNQGFIDPTEALLVVAKKFTLKVPG